MPARPISSPLYSQVYGMMMRSPSRERERGDGRRTRRLNSAPISIEREETASLPTKFEWSIFDKLSQTGPPLSSNILENSIHPVRISCPSSSVLINSSSGNKLDLLSLPTATDLARVIHLAPLSLFALAPVFVSGP